MSSPFPTAAFNIGDHAEKWMRDDLAKSGLAPEDMGAACTYGVGQYPWPVAELIENGKKTEQNVAVWIVSHYSIPYWHPDGSQVDNYFVRKPRFKTGTPHEVTEKKYVRPSKMVMGALAAIPYMHPGRIENTGAAILDIHEGEKKTACAVVKGGQCAIGIAGAHSWGDPERKGQLHPWIREEVERIQSACPGQRVKVRIWPDADYKTNQNVAQGIAGLASELCALDVEVVLMDLSAVRPGGKFDDLVVELGIGKVMAGVVERSAQTLPENPEALARKYQLLTQSVGRKDSAKQLPQAILENFAVLLERHPHFLDPATRSSLIWLDRDRQKPMFGTTELVENLNDVEIVRYFQRDLGFNGTGRTAHSADIQKALAYVLLKNARSPFNDRVKAAADRLRSGGAAVVEAADQLLDTWVVRFLHAADTEWNRRWGRKFLLSIVGRAMKPGCFMRTAYVIAGPQDIGKSAFMESIVGKDNVAIIRDENSQGKDLPMVYASCLVAVHDEMQAMTTRGMQSVKSDISATKDSIRPPYGKLVIDMPRRCVFLIPVDRMDFLLEDSAGMTRFAVLNLLESHQKGDRFDFAGLVGASDDLLGAALIAVESGEVFDVVEGAEESARPHLRADLNMEQIEAVLENTRFAPCLIRGSYKGREIVGFRLVDLTNLMPPGYKAAGGGSGSLTGPLRKLGFEQEDPNKNPLGVRRLWFMDSEKFDAQFTVDRRKFDA